MKSRSEIMKYPCSAIALVIGAGLMVSVATPAFAQASKADDKKKAEAEKKVDIASESKSGASADDGAIVVTGSRIRQNAFDSPSLVQVISRDDSAVAGFNSSTEVLQSTAVTGGTSQINNAFGGYVTNGGPGANTLSLRGLGATRTLVLLNGRRLQPAGTRGSVGAADLNTIPNGVVDHFEILKDGASSIYGSDAVAGVVNAITRKRVDGLEFNGGVSIPEFGGGVTTQLAGLYGKTGDRFNFVAAVEYLQRTPVTLGDRPFTQCQTRGRLSPPNLTPDSGSALDPLTGKPKCYPIDDTGDDGVTVNTIGTATRTGAAAPGAATNGSVGVGLGRYNRWRPNPSVTTGPFPGFEGVGGATAGFVTGLEVRDTFDPRMLQEYLYDPVKTLTGYFSGSYDIHALGNAEAYLEALVTRREGESVGFRQLTLDYGASDQVLLPANLPLASLPAFLNPTQVSNGETVKLRAFIGFGTTSTTTKVDFYRIGGGLKGDFAIPGWRYDLYFGKSRSKGEYTFESFLTDRVAQSLNAKLLNGQVVCVEATNGCVPGVLTNAVLGGDIPTAYRNFILQPVTGTTTYDEQLVSFGIDGNLFSLPAGSAKAFFGAEMRWEALDDQPALDSQNGNLYNLTSSTITKGKDNVKEVFGELEFPLFKGVKGAENLTVTVSGRYTNYKSYGGGFTYKGGAIYAPTGWLKFRGNYGTSFRAPALFEQFLGASSGFLSAANDPCDQYGSRDPASPTYKNCASIGLPTNFTQTSGITVLTKGGAETGLEAEKSKNWTLGMVLQPKTSSKFGNLELAADYYNIAVSNGVARLSANNLLDSCYGDPQFTAGNQGGELCYLVVRNPSNNALTVTTSYVNIADDRIAGIDFNARYSRDIGTGKLRLNGTATYVIHDQGRTLPTDDLTEVRGTIGSPRWVGTFDASYKLREWTASYGFEWIQGQDSTKYLLGDTAVYGDGGYDFQTNDYWTHYLALTYKIDNYSMTFGVRNLFDSKIPTISDGYYNRVGNTALYSGYDYLGRKFYMNFTAKF